MLNSLFVCGLALFSGVALVTAIFATRANGLYRRLALFATLLASLVFLAFSLSIVIQNNTYSFTLYHLTDTLRFSFAVDRLAAFFMLLISLVSSSVCIYSLGYLERHGSNTGKNLMVSMMSLFVLSMLLLVASDNTFSLLFFWETMSLTSFYLVMFDRDKAETQKSALFYFVMTQLSTVFLIFAFVVLYHISGSFDLNPVSFASPLLKGIVFLALFAGFSIKAGVMPFHKWLPYAHSASPSNISALMSGVMIKVAIYGLVRFLLNVLSPDLWWGVVILIFGTVSALLGVIYALKEHDIKKLLAYHSIENIGIILIGVGLYIIFQFYGLGQLALLALIGGLFHTLNHAVFKSLLFLTGGAVVDATGTRNIEKMGGLMKVMPYTGVLFLIGSVSIAALPPFNGFVSELMIFQSFLQSFSIGSAFMKILLFLGLSLFALTSALAAACFVKAFGIIFLAQPRSKEAHEAKEASPFMTAGAAVLAAVCIILGIFSFQIFNFLGFSLPIPNMAVIGLAIVLTLGAVWLLVRLTGNKSSRKSETWGCGLTSQNSKMEYTASGFSEPILTIFKPVYRTRKEVERNYHDTGHSIFSSGTAEIHTLKFFEERIYLPIAHFVQRISLFISQLQDVDLDTYILYSFIAIVILILIAGWLV
ncbi:MAG TPA: proton-conducting transporter membrane subunit [Dehalococcoidales bacterium]|nr:proton-conducting transporter membrane subunit [Dehalococcoidales bacterium]